MRLVSLSTVLLVLFVPITLPGCDGAWYDEEVFEEADIPAYNGEWVEEEGEEDLLPFAGTTPGSYDAEPWANRLPYSGNATVTCGYGGCPTHTGAIYYSVDLALSEGLPVYAAHSGYVMYVSPSSCKGETSGYGCQIIIRGKPLGNGRYFLTRYAHLKDPSPMRSGWWAWKDRQIGSVGRTGEASGPHIHFEWWRGYYSNRRIYGETLPITQWPGNADGFCNGSLNGYNLYGAPQLPIATNSSGCP